MSQAPEDLVVGLESGGVEEGKGEELLPEPDKLTVLVVEVCRVWTPLQVGAYFPVETGISCWQLSFSFYGLLFVSNTVSHLLF